MLSLVLPAYNEAQNLEAILGAITQALAGTPHEVIVVDDDSPDRTWETAEKLRGRFPMLRVIRRVGERGLASAAVRGWQEARGDTLAVMDSDGQHDPALLPVMLQRIREGADLVVASRYMSGGNVQAWGGVRLLGSKFFTALVRGMLGVPVTDPLGGYFMLRRSLFEKIALQLRPVGFKILLEVIAHLPPSTRVAEIPLTFGLRWHGQSKMSLRVQMQFLAQSMRIAIHRTLPFAKRGGGLGRGSFTWLFFVAVLLMLGLLYGTRLWRIRSLYQDVTLRRDVQVAMREYAASKGIPISDLTLVAIADDRARVVERLHHRGPEASHCVMLLRRPEVFFVAKKTSGLFRPPSEPCGE